MAEFAIQELSAISECAVCLSSATSPKILPCSHIFCLACIQGVYDQAAKNYPTTTGQLTCPVCTAVSPILAGDLTQLPNDFRTNRVTALIDELQKAKSSCKCFVCSRNKVDADAQVLCFDCATVFCSDCHETHSANKRFNDHIFTSLSPKELGKLRCTEHNEFYHTFCMDCSTGICKTCMLVSHTDHRIEIFSKSVGKPYGNSDTARAQAELGKLITRYTSIRRKDNFDVNTTKDNIRKHKLELIKKLDDQELQLFAKLDRQQSGLLDLLGELSASIIDTLVRLHELQSEAKIIARPFPMAPDIKLAVADPCVQYITECMNKEYKLPSPPQYNFTNGEVNLGILPESESTSEVLYNLKSKFMEDAEEESDEEIDYWLHQYTEEEKWNEECTQFWNEQSKDEVLEYLQRQKMGAS